MPSYHNVCVCVCLSDLACTRPICGPVGPTLNMAVSLATKFFCRLKRRCPMLLLLSITMAMSIWQSAHTHTLKWTHNALLFHTLLANFALSDSLKVITNCINDTPKQINSVLREWSWIFFFFCLFYFIYFMISFCNNNMNCKISDFKLKRWNKNAQTRQFIKKTN